LKEAPILAKRASEIDGPGQKARLVGDAALADPHANIKSTSGADKAKTRGRVVLPRASLD
jgi:hypothetical protein